MIPNCETRCRIISPQQDGGILPGGTHIAAFIFRGPRSEMGESVSEELTDEAAGDVVRRAPMKPEDEMESDAKTRRRRDRVEVLRRRIGSISVRVLSGPGARDKPLRWTKRRVLGGRSHSADLCLPDSMLSAVHFELRLDGDQVWLRDLGSTNGTWIGSNLVAEVGLCPGAVFEVGGSEIQLLCPGLVDVPVSTDDHFGEMYGRSSVIRETFAFLERVAETELDVVLLGETGTGKELAARAVHQCSSRRELPFLVLDCATLNTTLADATLFGHTRGAFTDAKEDRSGCFEQADGGTVFIDEVGDLPLDLQPKLLRALDRREVVRVGEVRPRHVDVRIIAATNRDLQRMVAEGQFRGDLYYRLAQVCVHLPALRERDGDVEVLANRFAEEFGGSGWTLSEGILERLRSHPWPGNVRELRAAIRAAISIGEGAAPVPGRLALGATVRPPSFSELVVLPYSDAVDAFERHYLAALLRVTDGNLSEAERRSGITRASLRKRLRRHQLRA